MTNVSALLIIPAVLGAAAAGYFLADHRAVTAATPTPVVADAPQNPAGAPMGAGQALPPNHPPVSGAQGKNPHGGAMPNAENQAPPSIDWKVPGAWQPAANASPMRLATYRTPEGAEVTVARAGGQLDANILRWSQQFEGTPAPERSSKEVHGVHVTVVRLTGTYSGGMGMGETEKHAGWEMLVAVAEAPGASYFFKVMGPVAQVDANRAPFDSLVESIAPHGAP